MARFYASICGNRGEATRMGSKDSGIKGHISGWRSGREVICDVDENGKDVISIYATIGSSYHEKAVHGLVLRTVDGKIDFLTTKKALLIN